MQDEARNAVDRYLKSVRENLHGVPAGQREQMVQDLESHIYEAVRARVGEREPVVEDVTAVLAEMDPPESYGGAGFDAGPSLGETAIRIVIYSVVAAVLLYLLGSTRLVSMPLWVPMFVFWGGQIAALVLGILSWSHPLGKAAAISSGLLLALSILFTA